MKIIIILISLLLIQGCFVNRLVDSKKQLCKNKIRLSITDSIIINFENPILYPEDVQKLLGPEPSKIINEPYKKIYEYKITKTGDKTGKFNIPILFEFIEENQDYYLVKFSAHKNLMSVLPNSLLNTLLVNFCGAKRKGRRIEVSLENISEKHLPDIQNIIKLLGNPSSLKDDNYAFKYELNNSESINIQIQMDLKDKKIKVIDITFFRYVFKLDFEKHIAVGAVKPIDLLMLGYHAFFSWH